MPYAPKIEGQVCSDCGEGKYVTNPKTNKVFCENKCWLKGGAPTQAQPVTKQEEKVDWDAKDRLHAAQTALNVAGNTFQGTSTPSATIINQAEKYYEWLRGKQLGGTSTEDEFNLPPNL